MGVGGLALGSAKAGHSRYEENLRSDMDAGLSYANGRYCPWGAKVTSIVD